jgi:hypothetical protein
MNPHWDPQELARLFAHYVRAMVEITVWGTIGLATLVGAYLAARCMWVAVHAVFKALGI